MLQARVLDVNIIKIYKQKKIINIITTCKPNQELFCEAELAVFLKMLFSKAIMD